MRRPIIYHGVFGSGFFQTLYTPPPAGILAFFSSLEYHVLLTLPLLIVSSTFHWLLPVAVASLLLSLTVCAAAAAQAGLPRKKRRFWSRSLVALLFFLQPIVRGWARYHGQLYAQSTPTVARQNLDSVALRHGSVALNEACYWADHFVDRIEFLLDHVALAARRVGLAARRSFGKARLTPDGSSPVARRC